MAAPASNNPAARQLCRAVIGRNISCRNKPSKSAQAGQALASSAGFARKVTVEFHGSDDLPVTKNLSQ